MLKIKLEEHEEGHDYGQKTLIRPAKNARIFATALLGYSGKWDEFLNKLDQKM